MIETSKSHTSEQPEWFKAMPKVTDDAILMPMQPIYQTGTAVSYKTVMTREVFIEAYKKWILGEADDENEQRVEN